MVVDDADLYNKVYRRIGDLMAQIWSRFLERHSDTFAVCRFVDDLGFKTSTLVSPRAIRKHVILQYKHVIDLIKGGGKPFLWHSCGRIFSIRMSRRHLTQTRCFWKSVYTRVRAVVFTPTP
jgi:uroporphyrinogen decarboxylase